MPLAVFVIVKLILTMLKGRPFIALNSLGSSLTSVQAKSMADSFYSAMVGLGTDEVSIYKLFSGMKSQYDFNKVYNAFGKRQYSSTFGNGGDPVTSDNKDLIYWLNAELNYQEKTKIKLSYPNVKVF